MLSGGREGPLRRLLAELVEARLPDEFVIPRRLVAVQLAETAFAPIRAWLAAEAACAPRDLAAAISAATAAVRQALRA